MHRLLVALSSIVFVAHAGLFAQQPARPTFRSGSQLVVQNVSVKDKDGRPIEGLTAKDFLVTEQGLPQQIAFVEYQRIDTSPVPPAAVDAAANPMRAETAVPQVAQAGIAVPLPGDARYRGRRLVILYLDLFNMPFFDQGRLYDHAAKYITTRMTAADMVAIMVFQNSRVRLKQDFTDDHAALLAIVEELTKEADEGETGAAVLDAGSAFGEDDDTFNLFATDRQLAALQTAVTGLGALPELKTLVYLGSGLRLTGTDNLAQLRATVNAAVRSNVTINPIDTRGLVATAPLGDATSASPGGVRMFSGALAQTATTRHQRSQDAYYALAKDTGGRAMFDNNDLSLGIAQAAQAVTGYYMLAYYTTHTARDGRYRRVKVALNGRTAELAYRSGYYGAKQYSDFDSADRERQLEEALRLEDPVTDIAMAMEVNYFRVNDAEYFVPVSVRIPGSELTRSPTNRETHAVIDMIGEIKDEFGVTVRNARDRIDFTLEASRASAPARRPIQYETGFTLLPGSYVIKMLARNARSGRIGTFQTSFTIPNLDREHVRLPISSVVLTNQRMRPTEALHTVKQRIPADVAHPLVHDGQKLIPGVSRTFSASHPLFVFLQAYNRDVTTPRPLVAWVTLYREGAKAFETEVVVSEVWDPKSRALPIRFSIPPGRLDIGSYECQVTVLDPLGARAAFWRAPISVIR
jgi:VWFA-related protein